MDIGRGVVDDNGFEMGESGEGVEHGGGGGGGEGEVDKERDGEQNEEQHPPIETQ